MDLTPENILFENSDGHNIKIIDFHLAQSTVGDQEVPLLERTLPSASPGEPFGTPYYMAPEVIDGCYDEKCDLWSVGCILYAMLTGFQAFQG